jgi:hypothetical protein
MTATPVHMRFWQALYLGCARTPLSPQETDQLGAAQTILHLNRRQPQDRKFAQWLADCLPFGYFNLVHLPA